MPSFTRFLLLGLGGLALPVANAAAQVKACELITRAEAAQILAKPAVANAQVISPDEEDCGYLGSGMDVHTELLKNAAGWTAAMKNQIKQGKAEGIDGIGEEAAYTKDGNRDYVLVTRKGNRIVTVTLYSANWSEADAKPKLIKLATLAVGKVH
jgi:hypothetical protein